MVQAAIAPVSATVIPPVRTRRMRLDVATPAPAPATPRIGHNSKVTSAMRDAALTFFLANKAANAAKSKADKDRKALLAMMKNGGVETFELDANIDGTRVALEAAVSTPNATYIDVEALRKLVDDKTFMAVISATKTSVDDHCGNVITARVTKTKPGKENVSVDART